MDTIPAFFQYLRAMIRGLSEAGGSSRMVSPKEAPASLALGTESPPSDPFAVLREFELEARVVRLSEARGMEIGSVGISDQQFHTILRREGLQSQTPVQTLDEHFMGGIRARSTIRASHTGGHGAAVAAGVSGAGHGPVSNWSHPFSGGQTQSRTELIQLVRVEPHPYLLLLVLGRSFELKLSLKRERPEAGLKPSTAALSSRYKTTWSKLTDDPLFRLDMSMVDTPDKSRPRLNSNDVKCVRTYEVELEVVDLREAITLPGGPLEFVVRFMSVLSRVFPSENGRSAWGHALLHPPPDLLDSLNALTVSRSPTGTATADSAAAAADAQTASASPTSPRPTSIVKTESAVAVTQRTPKDTDPQPSTRVGPSASKRQRCEPGASPTPLVAAARSVPTAGGTFDMTDGPSVAPSAASCAPTVRADQKTAGESLPRPVASSALLFDLFLVSTTRALIMPRTGPVSSVSVPLVTAATAPSTGPPTPVTPRALV